MHPCVYRVHLGSNLAVLQGGQHIGLRGQAQDVGIGSPVGDGNVLDTADDDTDTLTLQCLEYGGDILLVARLGDVFPVINYCWHVACQTKQRQHQGGHDGLRVPTLHQRLQQQADEPGHEEIDEGCDDEGEEGIECSRAY